MYEQNNLGNSFEDGNEMNMEGVNNHQATLEDTGEYKMNNFDDEYDASQTNFGMNRVNDMRASQSVTGSASKNVFGVNKNSLFNIPSPGQRGFAPIATLSTIIAIAALVICYYLFKV